MTAASKSLLVLAALLGAFAWWAMGTASGARAFDEMDGLIPFFAALLAAAFAVMGAVLGLIARYRAAARPPDR